MELNREQIVKALELHSQKAKPCVNECPYGDMHYCGSEMSKDALALIKELTEENERLRADAIAFENALEIALNSQKQDRADTVREFAGRLKACFCPDADYSGYDIKRVIEQIANDI